MTEQKHDDARGASASNAGLCVGGKVKLLKSIFDCGEDHHPPRKLAQRGEVLIVKAVLGDAVAVAHEGASVSGAFTIYPDEYEVHNTGCAVGRIDGDLRERIIRLES